MATITINDSDINNILVDGNSAGDIFSAAQHNPDAVDDIKMAITNVVAGLKQQVAEAMKSAVDNTALNDQVSTLTKQLADMTAERDTANRDNANLKAKMMSYLADSDSGKSLLLGLELMQVDALLTALTAKKAEIEKAIRP